MEKLSSLKPKNTTKHTPEELAIFQQFFEEDAEEKSSTGINWKAIGYSTLVFAILANPWIDTILETAPYVGNSPTYMFLFKLVLFIILLALASKYLC